MDDNPYKSPAPVSGLPQYYTDDITLMPASAIWRASRRQGLLGCVLLFPYFMIRKLLRLRLQANHGTPRVTELPAVPAEQIPAEASEAFEPIATVLEAQQMEHLRYIRSPCIGNKTVFTSLWLDRAGTTYGSVVWIDIRLGVLRRTTAVFSCHSWLQSGIILETAAVSPEDWIPELVPPNHDFLKLAPDTQPSQVIDRHRARISGRADLRRFDEDSLVQAIIHTGQELFDYLVARGIYAPLSEAEVERLFSATLSPRG